MLVHLVFAWVGWLAGFLVASAWAGRSLETWRRAAQELADQNAALAQTIFELAPPNAFILARVRQSRKVVKPSPIVSQQEMGDLWPEDVG